MFVLLSFAIAGLSAKYQILHVTADAGWAILTMCRHPAPQPLDPFSGRAAAEYTVAIGPTLACENPRVAVFHLHSADNPARSWELYRMAICKTRGFPVPAMALRTGECDLTYEDLYPVPTDFTAVVADERGVRSLKVPHGIVELHPPRSRATIRQAVRRGTMRYGKINDVGLDMEVFVGPPYFDRPLRPTEVP